MIKEGFHFLHLIYEVQLINTKEEQCSVQQHIVNDVAQEKRTTLILKKKKRMTGIWRYILKVCQWRLDHQQSIPEKRRWASFTSTDVTKRICE